MTHKPPNYEVERPLLEWVAAVAKITKPDGIAWCDGSDEEFHSLISLMIADGTLIKLNQEKYSNCYLHRSNPNDVARTEETSLHLHNEQEGRGSHK